MILEKYLAGLHKAFQTPRSTRYKAMAMMVGGFIFAFVLPALLFLAAMAVNTHILRKWSYLIQPALAVTTVSFGLLLLVWSVVTMLTVGKGTPVPLAPPRNLIVSGPYKYCRNPMMLGAILYYMGIGTYLGSVKIGLMMLLIALLLAGLYHKLVEEKELVRKFGTEYEEYRKKTPFLFPRL
jgi:protein-S-isoprenylcysteine O-methyltransferase Ste14